MLFTSRKTEGISTDSELYTYIHALDKTKKTGRKELGSVDPNSSKGRSADHTAKLTGTSATKVKKAKAIEKAGSTELKKEVKTGKKTINAAYREVKDKKVIENYLPKVTVSGKQILDVLKTFEDLLDCDESKLHVNCGKILGIYDLISHVIPMGKLKEDKYKSLRTPLLAAYTKVEDKIGEISFNQLAVCRTLPLSKKKNFQNSISRIKFLHECKFYKY